MVCLFQSSFSEACPKRGNKQGCTSCARKNSTQAITPYQQQPLDRTGNFWKYRMEGFLGISRKSYFKDKFFSEYGKILL
jgi:hypothetical protein